MGKNLNTYLIREDIQTSSKHMKRYLTSHIIIRVLLIKMGLSKLPPHTLVSMTKIQKTPPSTDEDVEQQKFSFIAHGIQNQTSYHKIQQLCSFIFIQRSLKFMSKIWTWIFVAALFLIYKIWKQLRCPSVGDLINCGISK